jgi:hypothetical protein
MADIMETNADNSPISVRLKNVFYMGWWRVELWVVSYELW